MRGACEDILSEEILKELQAFHSASHAAEGALVITVSICWRGGRPGLHVFLMDAMKKKSLCVCSYFCAF